MTLHAELAGLAARQPLAPCLGQVPWGEAWASVETLAARFAADRGRVVALALPTEAEQALALTAALVSGAIALPLAPGAPAAEHARLLAGLDVARVVRSLDDLADAVAWQPAAADDVALLVGTSGSTGAPKRVALTGGGLVWNARAHADALGLPTGVRTLVTGSLAHAFPLVALWLATLLRGGAASFPAGGFTPRGFLKQVAADGVGYAALPPTLLRLLRERNPEARDLPPLLSVGSAPIPAAELVEAAAWAARGGSRLYHTYGLSEAGPRVATLAPEDLTGKAASVGQLLPGVEARLEDGELWLRSPSVMRGYYPELTGVEADGWLRTGDRGRLDAEGFLYLEGRLKDVIVCGGVTVWARELEDALLADEAVEAAAVVAAPSDVYGEVPVAFVEAPGATPAALLARLTERLSRPKLPHRVVVVAKLPHTPLGKVDKAQLREAACEASR